MRFSFGLILGIAFFSHYSNGTSFETWLRDARSKDYSIRAKALTEISKQGAIPESAQSELLEVLTQEPDNELRAEIAQILLKSDGKTVSTTASLAKALSNEQDPVVFGKLVQLASRQKGATLEDLLLLSKSANTTAPSRKSRGQYRANLENGESILQPMSLGLLQVVEIWERGQPELERANTTLQNEWLVRLEDPTTAEMAGYLLRKSLARDEKPNEKMISQLITLANPKAFGTSTRQAALSALEELKEISPEELSRIQNYQLLEKDSIAVQRQSSFLSKWWRVHLKSCQFEGFAK